MPAQLGNALTQMMQLKGMRAQNKLAEFQMEQAKAAQEQAQRDREEMLLQREHLAKLAEDPDNAAALRAGVPYQTILSIDKAKTEENEKWLKTLGEHTAPIADAFRNNNIKAAQSYFPNQNLSDPQVYGKIRDVALSMDTLAQNAAFKEREVYKDGKTRKVYSPAELAASVADDWGLDKPEDLSAEEKAIAARMTKTGEDYDEARASVAATMKTEEILTPPEIYKRISQIETTRARLHSGESLTEEDYAAMPQHTADFLRAFGKAKPDPETLKIVDAALTAERQMLERRLPEEDRINLNQEDQNVDAVYENGVFRRLP